jgi:hypothetical protein
VVADENGEIEVKEMKTIEVVSEEEDEWAKDFK